MRALTVSLAAAVALAGGYVAQQAGWTKGLFAHDSDRSALSTARKSFVSSISPGRAQSAAPNEGYTPLFAQNTAAPEADPASTAKSQPVVDETALRYFAAKGDTKRLEAEIARLKVLYPDWTPPADPLAIKPAGDPELDRMWKLYADGKYAELRKAIGDRRKSDPAWTPPVDLLDGLAVAEAREQLLNASDVKQYETVLRVASARPALLTCADVDVLWRVAEAFAKTEKQDRARDAYRYVLTNCTDPAQRLATVQKALPLLTRSNLDFLLALEKTNADGVGEFASIRDDLARKAVGAGGEDPKADADPSDLETVEKLAQEKGLAADQLLLGWYYVRRDNAKTAEDWFRKALATKNMAEASQGLALALLGQGRAAQAEDVLYQWRDVSDEIRSVYLAATANLLAKEPPLAIAPEVLQRIVPVVYDARDPATAQQFGWYALALNQFQTASQWFSTALGWKPDDEASAYGLALTRFRLGDRAGVAQIQSAWRGRSERIARLGEKPSDQQRLSPYASTQIRPGYAVSGERSANLPGAASQNPIDTLAPANSTPIQPQPRAVSPQSSYVAVPEQRRPPAKVRQPAIAAAGAATSRGCASTLPPESLLPEAALSRGWCLMDLNRPMEAAAAFEVALQSRSQATRQDAAYGQSLAYLRVGLSREAGVAAAKAPQNRSRKRELRTALLANQATDSFEAGRYVEAILALDERARIAPERIDLMVLRGYAFYKLGRLGDARRVFEAAAATGSREGAKGLALVNSYGDP